MLRRRVALFGSLLLLWWTLRLAGRSLDWFFLDWVNLPFHEAGHIFFSPFGSTLHILGGTLLELIVPAVAGASLLLRQRSAPSAAVCLWWLGENLIYIARYMADARDLEMPLVGGGDHDWNELFYRFGLLSGPSVARVSFLTHAAGVAVMLLAVLWLAWFALTESKRESLREALATDRPWVNLFLS